MTNALPSDNKELLYLLNEVARFLADEAEYDLLQLLKEAGSKPVP